MSGGYFSHNQMYIQDIIDSIEHAIESNNLPDEYGSVNNYSIETLNEFKKAVEYLKLAYTYTRRIDWLMSGDDGEETFHRRLKEELAK